MEYAYIAQVCDMVRSLAGVGLGILVLFGFPVIGSCFAHSRDRDTTVRAAIIATFAASLLVIAVIFVPSGKLIRDHYIVSETQP